MKLTQQRPTAIQEAMLQTLRAGRWSGYIKPDIDLPTLADRICQTMLQVGLDVMRHNSRADQVAELLCRIILQGLAARPPTDSALDRSNAFAAANDVIETWSDDSDADPSDKARTRPCGGTNGIRPQRVRGHHHQGHRIRGRSWYRNRLPGDRIKGRTSRLDHANPSGRRLRRVGSASCARMPQPIEKLDALSWVNVNALDRFSDEFRIQLAWMRQSPPDTPNPGWLYATRLRQMKTLLSEGIRSGEISVDTAVHRDAGTVRHRLAVDTGEHSGRSGQTRGTGACP